MSNITASNLNKNIDVSITVSSISAAVTQNANIPTVISSHTVPLTIDANQNINIGGLQAHEINASIANAQNEIHGTIRIPKSDDSEMQYYTGEYEVIPDANDDQTLETRDKYLTGDVVVFKIPTYETSNNYGTTFIIGD